MVVLQSGIYIYIFLLENIAYFGLESVMVFERTTGVNVISTPHE